jgi:GntR family transcriptional repressor for pyruvate dehydrogenase complex
MFSKSDTNKLLDDTQNNIIDIIHDKLEEEGITAENHYFKEGDFADQLSVGRSTIREAIRSLEVRGYVKRVHGRGVKAIDNSVEALAGSLNDMFMRNGFDYMDMFEFRNIIEVQAAGIAACKRTEEKLDKMKQFIETMNDTNVTYEEYQDADFLFHEEIMKSTRNKMLIALITSYGKVIRYAIKISTDESYRPEIDEHFHEKIYKAVLDKDEESAKKCMEEHLQASVKNVGTLKKFKGINW